MVDINFGSGSGSGGYVNPGTTASTQRYVGSMLMTVTEPAWQSIDAIKDLPTSLWNQGQYQQARDLMKLVESAGFATFEEALLGASQDPQRNDRSWEQYLRDRAADPQLQALLAADKDKAGGQGGPYRYEDTTTSLSPESAAAADLDTIFQSELGRRATDEEIRAYTIALNEQQKKNPSTSVTSGVQTGNNRTASTTSTAAFDPTRFATEWAQSQPEWAETQAATTFMDLLDRAISSPNKLDDIASGR